MGDGNVQQLGREGREILDKIVKLEQSQIEVLIEQLGDVLANAKFNAWMQVVDEWLGKTAHVSHKDVSLYPWREWHLSGMQPYKAAHEALCNEGYDGGGKESDW